MPASLDTVARASDGIIVVEVKSPTTAKSPQVADRLSSRAEKRRDRKDELRDIYERLLRAAVNKEDAVTPVKAIRHNRVVAEKKVLKSVGDAQRRTFLQARARAKELRAKQLRAAVLGSTVEKAFQATQKQAAAVAGAAARDSVQKEVIQTRILIKQASASKKRLEHIQEAQEKAAIESAKLRAANMRKISHEQAEREKLEAKLKDKLTAADERRLAELTAKQQTARTRARRLERRHTWDGAGRLSPHVDTDGLLSELTEKMEAAAFRRQASLHHRILRASSMNQPPCPHRDTEGLLIDLNERMEAAACRRQAGLHHRMLRASSMTQAPSRAPAALRTIFTPDRHAAAELRRTKSLQSRRDTAAAHSAHVARVIATKRMTEAQEAEMRRMGIDDKQRRAADLADAALAARARGTTAFLEEMRLHTPTNSIRSSSRSSKSPQVFPEYDAALADGLAALRAEGDSLEVEVGADFGAGLADIEGACEEGGYCDGSSLRAAELPRLAEMPETDDISQVSETILTDLPLEV